ncbi:MAG: hypothetical protein KDD63_01110, partial [Bacteroidetes bacterium]|nr:hypothetical protein [Bacteroidota bacterium]
MSQSNFINQNFKNLFPNMSILPKFKRKKEQTTPLVNLFAYIRDLFTTTRPTLRFDQKSQGPYWPLTAFEVINHNPALAQHSELSCQWDDPTRPLLSLQRVENHQMPEIPQDLQNWIEIQEFPGKLPVVYPIRKRTARFEESANRRKAFYEFRNSAHGKSLDEVQDLTIPLILEKWITLSEDGGKILVHKIEEAEESFHDDEHRRELLIAWTRMFEKFEQETYP